MLNNVERIVIVGVGLIGGSFALGLKKAGYRGQIAGIGRSLASLQRAQQLGVIDQIVSDQQMADTVRHADFILIAAPVAQTAAILQSLLPSLSTQTVISDAGSTKSDVVAAARAVLGDRINQFVPAHPIAGRELNGPEAALADLYVGKKVVLTPMPENSKAAIATVAQLWQQCGALLHYLSPQEHDTVFASVSHLPHLLAYALVDDIASKPHADLLFQYAASGFRDFTRIAGSSPEMWRDITLANRQALLQELDAYTDKLTQLRAALVAQNAPEIEAVYQRAQRARHNWLNAIESAEKQRKEGGN